ncbi:MAG: FecR domain-containing protein, partial [Acidobacteriota bacterium]
IFEDLAAFQAAGSPPVSDLPPVKRPATAKTFDWYSVSVESMRRTLAVLLAVIAMIGMAFAYQQWASAEQRRRAFDTVSRAAELAGQLAERPDFAQIRREFYGAWEDLEDAEEALEAENFATALARGQRSLLEFERVAQRDDADAADRGQFLGVAGGVEFRRGERGAWKRARAQDFIYFGDWVKTSAGGSAEIVFPDGSEFTLRANTMVHLTSRTDRFGRNEQVTEMSFGWVELATDDAPSKVATPKSEAEVRGSSSALVAYDRDGNTSRFAAFTGSVEVRAENGQTRELASLQQVTQTGDLLSEASSLPRRPRPVSPADGRTIRLGVRELRLDWGGVAGAASYDLRVARNALFAASLVEDEERQRTSARLGLRSEGVFYWQVAARDAAGLRGPWSEPRSFRVARPEGGDRDDGVPPPLRIEDIQTYGSLTLITGSTEAGAEVTVNDEVASIDADGAFQHTMKLSTEGFTFVDIVATDRFGASTREQRRVFIETTD